MSSGPSDTQMPTPKTRRSNKPLMEKRRRERINKSLNSLKELVLLAEQKDLSKFNKLEKADILEMTVRHVKSLHENSELSIARPNDCVVKYRAGFDRCTSEVENFLYSHQNLPPEMITRVLSHLKLVSNALSKEPASARANYVKGETKVKATIDTSVLRADVIRHEGEDTMIHSPLHTHNSYSKTSESNALSKTSESDTQPVKLELMISTWGSSTSHSFPPSPPDSSRCSSSPDSLRGSPRNIFDHGIQGQSLDKQITAHPYLSKVIRPETDFHVPFCSSTQNTKPLNLTIPHSTRREESYSPSSLVPPPPPPPSLLLPPPPPPVYERTSPSRHNTSPPRVLIKQEPHVPPLSPPSGRSSPADQLGRRQSGNALQLEAGPSRRHSFKSVERPTPYPKKDAVKRYQTQNPSILNETPQNVPNVPLSAALPPSHWRPW